MAKVLPIIASVPQYRFSTTLDGSVYLFDFRWNSRDEAWFMDVRTEDGVLIRAGLKIVLGCNIGGRVTDDRFPPGVFQAYDMTNRGIDATLDDFGTRVLLYYIPVAEVIA